MKPAMQSVLFASIVLDLAASATLAEEQGTLLDAKERAHLSAVRQLTAGGSNAECYWGPDGTRFIFQATREPYTADQIYTMRADGGEQRMVSTGRGRTTCAYFLPGGERILYASTHAFAPDVPPRPDRSKGYVWPCYPSYEIFTARADGSELKRLSDNRAYDAEATVCWKTGKVVFTSDRDGDLELYTMDADGSNVRRITHTLGYDGGAFFSADGSKIVWRASRPQTEQEIGDYKALLAEHLVRPTQVEIFVADADGSNVRQLTDNGAANFAPFFFPDAKRVIFASNVHNPDARRPDFDLYTINVDGSGLERVTFDPAFDAFPMFSPDGRKLVWVSSRNATGPHEFNVFVGDWKD